MNNQSPEGGKENIKFRKKPVVIEAVQWRGTNEGEIMWFTRSCTVPIDKDLIIPTLEGDMKASQMDWIIKGVNGEFYPCKPDIFEKTYEPAESPQAPSAGMEEGMKWLKASEHSPVEPGWYITFDPRQGVKSRDLFFTIAGNWIDQADNGGTDMGNSFMWLYEPEKSFYNRKSQASAGITKEGEWTDEDMKRAWYAGIRAEFLKNNPEAKWITFDSWIEYRESLKSQP